VVVNAIKYGKPGTSIAVVPRADESAYYIDVINFGEGIEAGDEERIFDRYYRATRRKVPGIGLGLYISRAAVEKNGAKLFVSRLADPTIFTFSFPRKFALSN